MSQPNRTLVIMLAILAAVLGIGLMLWQPLWAAFMSSPVFNAVIIAVFVIGVLVNIMQVLRLQKEVDWMEAWRRSNPEQAPSGKPVLLAPMVKMLGSNRRPNSLSATSLRSLLDSVYLRLEEQRDLSRYLIGLLIFLGLLGTFWGLLRTIGSVSDIISGLSSGSDALAMFDALKTELQEPLSGMATSFSTSLFGLAGSLVVGLFDLFAQRASNRFYSELEDWLSGMTKLSSGGVLADGDASVPAYVQALLEQTADGLERMQRVMTHAERDREQTNRQLNELSTQLGKLADAMNARDHGGGNQQQLSEELRSEFRLLSRTIAHAMEQNQGQRSS